MTCRICTEPVEPGRRFYCSEACMLEANRLSNFQRRHPHAYKPKPCQTCGTEFKPSSSNSRYCSPVCQRGKRTCAGCGVEFVPSRHARGKYCNRECWYEHQVPTFTRRVQPDGYVLIKVPVGTPGSRRSGPQMQRWMSEHRYVMQEAIGRALSRSEHVHHINGDRADNRLENLELWKGKSSQPHGVRQADYHCPGCRCHEIEETDAEGRRRPAQEGGGDRGEGRGPAREVRQEADRRDGSSAPQGTRGRIGGPGGSVGSSPE